MAMLDSDVPVPGSVPVRALYVVVCFLVSAFLWLVGMIFAVLIGESFAPYEPAVGIGTWVAAGPNFVFILGCFVAPFKIADTLFPFLRRAIAALFVVCLVATLWLYAIVFQCTSQSCI